MVKQQSLQQNSQLPPRVRQDSRGKLIEIFKGSFAQCNILQMKKGTVWGNHYHKRTTEYFYIAKGKILLIKNLIFNKTGTKSQTYKAGGSFTIYPYTLHTMHVLEPTKCIVLYSHQFSDKEPDLYRQ